MAVIKRGDSYRVAVFVRWDDHGKPVYHWETVKGNKKAALDRDTELKNELRTGAYVKPGKEKLGSFLDRWLEKYVNPSLAPRTCEGYEQIIRVHLKPSMGGLPLTAIRKPMLARYYSDKLGQGLSAQTIAHHHTVLHKAFETAIEWGLLVRNPADKVSLPAIRKPEQQVWTPEKVARFLEEARKTDYYVLFYLILYTGMRRSEALALRWKDLELPESESDSGYVAVVRGLHHTRKKEFVFRPTKSHKSQRPIPIPPSAVKVLKEYREKCQQTRESLELSLDEESLVFFHLDTGQPLLPGSVSHAWTRIANIAGVPRIPLKNGRHTHASVLLKQKVHPKVVQERLGHANIQITMDTYSHLMPGIEEEAAASFDEAIELSYNNTKVV